MSEAISIKRHKSANNDTSFESLRSEAIKLVQQVSGKVWTDYNLHDPGITILEQLIYAITDIIYRTDFPVEDYLTGNDGEVPYNSLALHSPAEAFPCRPVTINDYRKIIIDGAEDIVNLWLDPVKASSYSGLYKIFVKIENGLDEESRDSIENKIRLLYNENRNLCEDLADLYFITNIEYELCATIEVSGTQCAEDIVADIYYECSQHIAGSVSSAQLDQLVNQDDSLDEVFDGPVTRHGFIDDNELDDNQQEFLISSLYAVINSIDGVKNTGEVYLQKDNKQYFDCLISEKKEQEYSLLIPETTEEIKITLTKNGRLLTVDINKVRLRISEKKFKHRATLSPKQKLSTVASMPKGVSRKLNTYSTIQNQFPANYGVNSLGVPKSAPLEVKAKARQLKSYLVIFEQFLTNYLANIDAIKTLFSITENAENTYSFNLLENTQIADLDLIYPENVTDVIKRIISKYDDYNNRKSRLLDYLLALYGEKFTQNSLRSFNYYYANNEMDALIVKNKIDFLSSIIELGRDRGAAENYSSTTNIKRSYSGLQLRVSMLLGFEKHTTHSLTMAILRQGIKMARHSVYERTHAGSADLSLIGADEIDSSDNDSFEIVPLDEFDKSVSVEELREVLADTIPLKNNLLSDMLLRGGIYLDRYKVVRLSSEKNYQLLFKTDTNEYWYVGTYDDKESANKSANALRQFLIILNKQSEGLHIVEHIMLRPLVPGNNQINSHDEDNFYSFKMSVVFSQWTARCYDKEFRKLAEETVRLNMPAHLSAEFYWLDFRKMYEFEIIYIKWSKLRRNPESDIQEIDDCSSQLKSFLTKNRDYGLSVS